MKSLAGTGLDWTGLYDGMMGESLEVVVRRSEFQKGTGGEGGSSKKKIKGSKVLFSLLVKEIAAVFPFDAL